jgi:hypothetical protein
MTNQTRFAYSRELSSFTQYRHIPIHRKIIPAGPKIPRIPQGSLFQNDILSMRVEPNNSGLKAIRMIKIAERRKSFTTVPLVSHSSLSQASGSQKIPTRRSFIDFQLRFHYSCCVQTPAASFLSHSVQIVSASRRTSMSRSHGPTRRDPVGLSTKFLLILPSRFRHAST